jgi:hypothetical protein
VAIELQQIEAAADSIGLILANTIISANTMIMAGV